MPHPITKHLHKSLSPALLHQKASIRSPQSFFFSRLNSANSLLRKDAPALWSSWCPSSNSLHVGSHRATRSPPGRVSAQGRGTIISLALLATAPLLRGHSSLSCPTAFPPALPRPLGSSCGLAAWPGEPGPCRPPARSPSATRTAFPSRTLPLLPAAHGALPSGLPFQLQTHNSITVSLNLLFKMTLRLNAFPILLCHLKSINKTLYTYNLN